MEGLPSSADTRSVRWRVLSERKLVLWRHGRTAWNVARRFQGHTDVPLDGVGRSQARLAAGMLAGLSPSMIISSDLQRARDTAAELASQVGLQIGIDADLRETYAGAWEGLTRDELESQYGAELAAWAAGSDLSPGGGERRSEVAHRMQNAIYRALAVVPDQGVLVVVTHGGSARSVIGSLLGLPTEHWAILGVLTNGAWCVLNETAPVDPTADTPLQPPWRLVEYNARTLPEEASADDR